jgi:hypothetical protein
MMVDAQRPQCSKSFSLKDQFGVKQLTRFINRSGIYNVPLAWAA